MNTGIDPFEYRHTDFAEASLFDPAPMNAPTARTDFLERMSFANIYGQFNLMFKRAEQTQLGMKLLAMHCNEQIRKLEDDKRHLLEQAKAVKEAKALLDSVKSRYKRLSDQNRAHQAEIAEVIKNPEIKKYLAKRQTSHSHFAVDSPHSARFTAFSTIARITTPSQFGTR